MTSRPETIAVRAERVAGPHVVIARSPAAGRPAGEDPRTLAEFAADCVAPNGIAVNGTREHELASAASRLPDASTAIPTPARQLTASVVPAGAYLAGAIGVGAVILSLLAGNSSSEFPGAGLDRAMFSHPPAAPAGPPEWMLVDPSLPDHVLAAQMVEDPGVDVTQPQPVAAAAAAAPPEPEPRDASVSLAPSVAFTPVVPRPAARPGRPERADDGIESKPVVERHENAGRGETASSQSAPLAAMPPPPPVARAARANIDRRQRGAGAALADNAPTVLDKFASVARAAETAEKSKRGPGGVEVQLIAVGRRDQAVAAWSGLVRANDDLLGALVPAIVGGEGRGSLFRLRAGPFELPEQARLLCASLKQRNVDCVVVQQGG